MNARALTPAEADRLRQAEVVRVRAQLDHALAEALPRSSARVSVLIRALQRELNRVDETRRMVQAMEDK